MALQKSKTTKISSKSQITLPIEFLEEMGIEKGAYVKLTINADKSGILIQPENDPIDFLQGIMKDSSFTTAEFLREKKEENQKRNKKLNLDI